MRIEVEKTVDGKRVEVLVPENEEDLDELARREREGGLDDRLSFADSRPPRRRRSRRHRPTR